MSELLKRDGVDLGKAGPNLTIDGDVRVMDFNPLSESFCQLSEVILYQKGLDLSPGLLVMINLCPVVGWI